LSYITKLTTFGLLLISLTLLISCEPANKDNKETESNSESVEDELMSDLTYTFNHPDTDQTFKIVHAYKLYENYEKELENNPDEHELRFYKQEVIAPVYEDCFEDVEHPPREMLNDAPTDFENIQSIVNKIDSEKMNGLIEEALLKSSDVLPSAENKNVCVFPPMDSYSNYSGLALGSENMVFFNDGFFDDESIQALIAHEYQHTVQQEKEHYESNDLDILDIIVREGKSVMFEKLVYPEGHQRDVKYNYDNADYWPEVEPDLFNVDYARADEILFGGDEFPVNYGYSEGYKIVESYLDLHPDVDVEEWTGLSGKEIYEEGDYADY